jgi:2-(1,2-epoxy-1,2-dihydrophenyl)acetyl-CoA isomerase
VSERTSSEPAVLLDVRDGVARLTLNRPDAANAIDLALAKALKDSAAEIAATEGVRVVVLRGAGARFCGGGDVPSFADAADGLADALHAVLAELHPAVELLASLDAPVVAAVQGSAAGAGLALVAGADLAIAAASTKFVMAYTAIGLVPDGGSTWYLPRAIGMRRALELALTNRVLSAEEACDWGLVNRVVDDAELDDAVEALVGSLVAGAPRALGSAKALMRSSLAMTLDAQLAHEATRMVLAGGSAAGQEGVAAFVAKRPPEFPG